MDKKKLIIRNTALIAAALLLIFAAMVYFNIIPLENTGSITIEVNGKKSELSFISATPYPDFWELYFTDNKTHTVALYLGKNAASGQSFTLKDTSSGLSKESDKATINIQYFAFSGDNYYSGYGQEAGFKDFSLYIKEFSGKGRPAVGNFSATLNDRNGTKIMASFDTVIKLFPKAPSTPNQNQASVQTIG